MIKWKKKMKWDDSFIDQIILGDCVEVMKEMSENSVDAIVTDPPYGLEFMGKKWDRLMSKENGFDDFGKNIESGRHVGRSNPYIQSRVRYRAGLEMQLWHIQWLTEAYRILKPGASMLIMGGTRTFHRLMVAIEDSGFIIKDCLMWIYGSGFPKAQEASALVDSKVLGISTKEVKERREVIGENIRLGDKKAYPKNPTKITFHTDNCPTMGKITAPLTDLAQHWDGFKIGGIKPAYEPVVWAVKPPEGSYIDNVLKWEVGAVNVDECRIGTDDGSRNRPPDKPSRNTYAQDDWTKNPENRKAFNAQAKGRFPANVILSHHPECEQIGVKRVRVNDRKHTRQNNPNKGTIAKGQQSKHKSEGYADSNGFEAVESWACHSDCAIRIMDEQSKGLARASMGGGTFRNEQKEGLKFINSKRVGYDARDSIYYDSGGASRFFYCAKASRGERNRGLEGMEEKDACHYNQSGRRYGGGNRENWQDPYKKPQFQNNHPTVKPIALFEWLIRLVTREGQIVLDPFVGSGTTAISADKCGRRCIGIDRERGYVEIAEKRSGYWKSLPKQMEIAIDRKI